MKVIKDLAKSVNEFYNPSEMPTKLKSRPSSLYEKPRRNRDDLEDIEVGGYIPLIDAFVVLLKQYENDKQAGQDIMHKLLPPHEDPTRPEFLLYYMTAKMARTEKSHNEIFKLMDEDGRGTLSYSEFIESMQTKLDIMFSVEECEEMFKHIDADGSGVVDIEKFVAKLQTLIYKSYPKDKWTVTKAQLMQSIVEEFNLKRSED